MILYYKPRIVTIDKKGVFVYFRPASLEGKDMKSNDCEYDYKSKDDIYQDMHWRGHLKAFGGNGVYQTEGVRRRE